MGKITVKHYLDKRLQDVETQKFNKNFRKYGEGLFIYFNEPRIVYPVYIQISINHKTTKLRSFTRYKLTLEEFEKYKQTGSYEYEDYNGSLKNEVDRVVRILEYLINAKNIDYSKYDLVTLLIFYSRRIDDEFYQWACSESLMSAFGRNRRLIPLNGFINKKINPIKLIDYFNKVFKFDINPYLNENETLLVNAFGHFIKSLPQVKEMKKKPILIDWYNGNAQFNFKNYLLKKRISTVLRNKYVQTMEDFCTETEDLFLTVVEGKYSIDSYDNM